MKIERILPILDKPEDKVTTLDCNWLKMYYNHDKGLYDRYTKCCCSSSVYIEIYKKVKEMINANNKTTT